MNDSQDINFRQFAALLEAEIARYGGSAPVNDQSLLEKQRQQFESLIDMERDFRESLIRSRHGGYVYRAFVRKICDDNGNILTARPYFRERQDICIGPITQALKKRHVQSLYQYHFNFNFVTFALGCRQWPPRGKFAKLAKGILKMRREIIVTNMPLAISEARRFWQKAPLKTQDKRFTFMDFVQVAADGMSSAVDKFVVPTKEELDKDLGMISVWRSVAIQRMTGNFIEMFSETPIHFVPQDKRKLYRANKHLKDHQEGIDFELLAKQVNEDLGPDGPKTNATELASIMSAAAIHQSADTQDEGDTQESILDRAVATEDWQPDRRFEIAQIRNLLFSGIDTLSLRTQKVLKMRGINQDSI